MNFFLTFGQKSPASNGWVRIVAPSIERAREIALSEYGQDWSGLYEEYDISPEFYPVGELKVLR